LYVFSSSSKNFVMISIDSGMILFGWLADKIGRRKGFIATLLLVTLGAIASSAAFSTPYTNVFVTLCIFQAFLGIGIGGEYPLSATITGMYRMSEV